MKSPNIAYLPGIDHLRGFAALLILFYHGQHFISREILFGEEVPSDFWLIAGNPISSFFVEGHTAVALFMVLSGFIFTYGAYGKTIEYWGFIRNRFLRIYPLFIFLMVVGMFIVKENYTFMGMIQSLLFLQNMPGALNIGDFSAMFWTISVEFLFYFIFPFLFMILKNEGPRKLLLLVLIAIIFRSIGYLFDENIRDISYWTIVGRIDQFIVGMLAARVFIESKFTKQAWVVTLVVSSVTMLVLILGFNKLGGWPVIEWWKIIWPTIEGIGWAVVILSYVKLGVQNRNILQRGIARIGEISFSIYMIHFIIVKLAVHEKWFMELSGNAFRDSMLSTLIIVLPITLGISFLTYHTIEKTFLNKRVKYLKED